MKRLHALTHRQAAELVEKHGSPLLVLSTTEAEANYATMKKLMPRVIPHYAMKANPHPALLQTFARLGAHFDVATIGEIETLAQLGISCDKMLYANTVKPNNSMKKAYSMGLRRSTFDSPAEIDKIAQHMPGSTVLLRIGVVNPGALVNLNKKFGAPEEEALNLIQKAHDAGLDIAGLSFHVGSQTRESKPYFHALASARRIFDAAKKKGLNLHILDLGGGWPIAERGQQIDGEKLMSEVYSEIERLFPDTELWAEPGRAFCGTTVTLITTVIGKEERGGKPWYFLDDGLYGSFSGIIFDHWTFDLLFDRQGPEQPSTFAGPSCDSLDVLFEDRLSPELQLGDLIITPDAGAYTSASATTFNGFPRTKYVIWEEEQSN